MFEQVKRIAKKPMVWITMVGIALIPSLYNISFLTSMWDPYGRVDQLPVAVVNQDKPATLDGKQLTIGQDMVESMKENPSLDFHFVSQKEAEDGLADGDYYMIVTLPENTSEKAASLMTDHPEPVDIAYQTSKGHSFVASKMGESAMTQLKDSLSQTITETYTKSVFASMTELGNGMDKAASGSHQLLTGADQLVTGNQSLHSGLVDLSDGTQTLASGANQLATGVATYTDGVGQTAAGSTKLLSGLTAYTDAVNQVAAGSQAVSDKSAQLVSGMAGLTTGADKVTELANGMTNLQAGLGQLAENTNLSAEEQAQMDSLIAGLPQLATAIDQLNSSVSSLTIEPIDPTALTTSLTNIAAQSQSLLAASQNDRAVQVQALQATSAYQSLPADQQAELLAALDASPSSVVSQAQAILGEVQNLQTALSSLQGLSSMAGQVSTLQGSLAQINGLASQALPGASTALTSLSSGLAQVNQALTQQVLPASNQLTDGANQLASQLTAGVGQLTAGVGQYTQAVDQLAAGSQTLAGKNAELLGGGRDLAAGLAQLNSNSPSLQTGVQALATGSGQLVSGAGQLVDGDERLGSGLNDLGTGISSLDQALAGAGNQLSLVSFTEKNAQAVANPVTLTHKDEDEVATNGVGMAPYMISVSLMVVALSANVIFVKHLDDRPYRNRWDWAKSKLVLNGLIASAAALILYFVLGWIGVEPSHPLATLGLMLLTSWTFMALVTALLGWNNRFGSFASLILLLLQLGSSAGTYPIELSPRIFSTIQPFLPMTYSVSGLRQTISIAGQASHQVTSLFIFLLIFLLAGLLIYRQDNQMGKENK